jgi:O-acetylserine/cysteine efflux transporter
MIVLALYKVASGLTGTAIGFALVIAAAFAWAVGNIIAKRSGRRAWRGHVRLTVWSSLVPPLPLSRSDSRSKAAPTRRESSAR